MTDRIWLYVPYTQKDTAKAAEAWWDPEAKSWYASRPGMRALDRRLRAPNAELLDFSTTPTPLYREPSANSGVTLDASDDLATILQGATADEPRRGRYALPMGGSATCATPTPTAKKRRSPRYGGAPYTSHSSSHSRMNGGTYSNTAMTWIGD